MRVYRDQMGNEVRLDSKPKRIISLVPSQSEYLWDLGLREELLGITKFCIHPDEMFRTVKRIGGTKKVNFDAIAELRPDLIIGNKEENTREDIEELKKDHPVWMSDIVTVADALQMMTELAEICDKLPEGNTIVGQVQNGLNEVKGKFSGLSCAYMMWYDPWMAAAGGTFIDSMLQHVGFENLFSGRDRYPVTSIEELRQMKPDVILLSSEPFPFSHQHKRQLEEALPDCRTLLIDGELFSWYGSRLTKLAAGVRKIQDLLSE